MKGAVKYEAHFHGSCGRVAGCDKCNGICRNGQGGRSGLPDVDKRVDTRCAESEKYHIGFSALFGPAIKVELPHHFFLDASYLFSLSDYTFTNDTVYNDERQDATMTVGYMIVPEFGVLAGNKISWFKEKETGFKDTVYGPLIGMIGIAPMYYNAAFYGKLDYLFTKFRQRGGGFADFKEDSPGWDLEFGFKIDFTREFSGTFGYRYETNTGSDSNIQDSFSGLIFGGMFNF